MPSYEKMIFGITEIRDEGPSRVSFELKQVGISVKLTVIQENDMPDSITIDMASNGWPLVMASIKSYLETGECLAETRHWPKGM